jgi:hypothetical protein
MGGLEAGTSSTRIALTLSSQLVVGVGATWFEDGA